MPQSRKLPFRYWLQHLEGTCETELRELDRLSDRHDVALDIGANVGLFSYKMSKSYSKVYAFEINNELTQELASYNPGNIEIINKGLSSQESKSVLYIPVLNGSPLMGWASLSPGNCPDTQEHREKDVEICPLDAFNIRSVSLIKIDVEGHEMEVLKGATQTLALSRPTVLIEIKQQNIDGVFAFFDNLNYKQYKLQDLIGIPGSDGNYIFMPQEQRSTSGS